jgi:hypothetical protein
VMHLVPAGVLGPRTALGRSCARWRGSPVIMVISFLPCSSLRASANLKVTCNKCSQALLASPTTADVPS